MNIGIASAASSYFFLSLHHLFEEKTKYVEEKEKTSSSFQALRILC